MLWAFIGTMYLIFLTWEDYRHKMLVDDRKNYFMMGMSLMLISIYPRPWWYILSVIAVVLLFGFVFSKLKSLGGGDVKSLIWIFYGFAIIAFNTLIVFSIIFIILLVIYELVKRIAFKEKNPLPFYGVLLISYVFSCSILGLYL